MSEFTKLAIGEDVTFQVQEVRIVKTGKWPEYEWLAVDQRTIVTPQAAMDRQFAKHKLSPVTIEGHVVRIERAPNQEDASKSWWNLHIMGKADLQKASPSRRIPPPSPEVPSSGPPAFFADVPLPEDPNELIEAAEQAVAQFEGKRGDMIESYLNLYDYVAQRLVKIGKANDFPVDGQSINAATATIAIQLDKRSLL